MLPVKAGQNGSSPFTSLKPKTTLGGQQVKFFDILGKQFLVIISITSSSRK